MVPDRLLEFLKLLQPNLWFEHYKTSLNSSLAIPGFVACLSAVILLKNAISTFCHATKHRVSSAKVSGEHTKESRGETTGKESAFFSSSSKNSRRAILQSPYTLLRLSGCLLLLALTIHPLTHAQHKPPLPRAELSLCLTYLYASLLALLPFWACSKSTQTQNRLAMAARVQRHLTAVLLALLSVHIHRHVLPLCTFRAPPHDTVAGAASWLTLALLALTALGPPLLQPRAYVPVDPSNPARTPHPEQTASILSLAFYAFLDPTVFRAHRASHLPFDLFPPLADYDAARYLRARNFPHLDPFHFAEIIMRGELSSANEEGIEGRKRRHLALGLIRVFRGEIATLAGLSFVCVLGKFVLPVGVNSLLRYIETNGNGATVRPWVWVVWLFLGPTIYAVGEQWYMFVVCRATVRLEAMLTQLIFEHALRIRVNHTGDYSEPTPANPGLAGSGGGSALTGMNIGMLNNLITADIQAIIAAKRLVLAFVYLPLQLVLSLWFLYSVLGFSAFIGMGAIVAMLPVPGHVGRWVQAAQRELARKRDGRVQSVTETVNLIRMIKSFGWEHKMSEEIAAKRRVELECLWRRKLLDLVNRCIDIFIPIVTILATYATYVSGSSRILRAFLD